jgi:hypothetical protein
MSASAGWPAKIVRGNGAIVTSAGSWWPCDKRRSLPTIRSQYGGQASGNYVQPPLDDEECRAIRRLFDAMNSRVGNLPSMPGIFPDYPAPIVRNAADGRNTLGILTSQPSRLST